MKDSLAALLHRGAHTRRCSVFYGDCVEVLRDIETDSVDSLVTDPPAGIAFMGKDWDKDKGGRDGWVAWMTEVMRECLRVLKPGAHGLVWAIPRTSHRTATALEDAGFEVRDCITHLFGSGFPKSLDVSKAIDKAAGAERAVTGLKSTYRKPQSPNGWDCSKRAEFETAPATPDAEKWQGWGTALKPAVEFWWLVRKPLGEKTVAANVLKHGTGALNIDGCRIGTEVRHNPSANTSEVEGRQAVGRFPANLVLSHSEGCSEACEPDCAVRMLDERSGTLRPGERPAKRAGMGYHGANGTRGERVVLDSGGASRFFYCAKASRSDRGDGNTHPTVKSTRLMDYLIRMVTPPGGRVLDPFTGSGSTGVAALRGGFAFVGVEQEKPFYKIAVGRLRDTLREAKTA